MTWLDTITSRRHLTAQFCSDGWDAVWPMGLIRFIFSCSSVGLPPSATWCTSSMGTCQKSISTISQSKMLRMWNLTASIKILIYLRYAKPCCFSKLQEWNIGLCLVSLLEILEDHFWAPYEVLNEVYLQNLFRNGCNFSRRINWSLATVTLQWPSSNHVVKCLVRFVKVPSAGVLELVL